MTRFIPPKNPSLEGKVLVISGGSSGIGAATVQLAHSLGCSVVFGDVDTTASEALLKSLTNPSSIVFVPCDVTKYADVLTLFRTARERFGKVDHAIANAGVVERPGLFSPRLTVDELESRDPSETEPAEALKVLDVNLRGVVLFAHVACVYLSAAASSVTPADPSDGTNDKSLTLLSSVAGFKEHPGLFAYGASKHGVLGLMRALRLYAPKVYNGLRVNAVCPSFTETRMVQGVRDGWVNAGLPTQGPEAVAKVLVGIMAAGKGEGGSGMVQRSEGDGAGEFNTTKKGHAGGMDWDTQYSDNTTGLNGRAIYVVAGECWDIEEGLDRTEHVWLGEETSRILTLAGKALGDGTQWTGFNPDK